MRLSSIDVFRGFSVVLMFLANFITLLSENPPALLSHALPGRVLPLDLVAPFFGFAMGLCLPFTLASRTFSWTRLIRRVLTLFLLGYLPHFFYSLSMGGPFGATLISTWGILETWALTYVVAFVILQLPTHLRLPLAITLTLFYQVLLLQLPSLSRWVLSLPEGGPIAVLSWCPICVAGAELGGSLVRNERSLLRMLLTGTALLLMGIFLHIKWAPMNRLSVTPAYTVFAAGACIIAFLIISRLSPWFGPLQDLGSYPLLAWVLQGLVYGPVSYTVGWSYFPWPTGLLLAVMATTVISTFTSLLAKAGLRVKA